MNTYFLHKLFEHPRGPGHLGKIPGTSQAPPSKPKEDKLSREGTNFSTPTPSRGRPPPHPAVSPAGRFSRILESLNSLESLEDSEGDKRATTNVQHRFVLFFLLYFLLFCSHWAKALCFEGESPGGIILKKCEKVRKSVIFFSEKMLPFSCCPLVFTWNMDFSEKTPLPKDPLFVRTRLFSLKSASLHALRLLRGAHLSGLL